MNYGSDDNGQAKSTINAGWKADYEKLVGKLKLDIQECGALARFPRL